MQYFSLDSTQKGDYFNHKNKHEKR